MVKNITFEADLEKAITSFARLSDQIKATSQSIKALPAFAPDPKNIEKLSEVLGKIESKLSEIKSLTISPEVNTSGLKVASNEATKLVHNLELLDRKSKAVMQSFSKAMPINPTIAKASTTEELLSFGKSREQLQAFIDKTELGVTSIKAVMKSVFNGDDISAFTGEALELANIIAKAAKNYEALGNAQRNLQTTALKDQEKALRKINDLQDKAIKNTEYQNRQKHVTSITTNILTERKEISTDAEINRALIAAQRLSATFASARGSTEDLTVALNAGLLGELREFTGDMNRVYLAAKNFNVQSQKLGSSFEQIKRSGADAGKSISELIAQLNSGIKPLEIISSKKENQYADVVTKRIARYTKKLDPTATSDELLALAKAKDRVEDFSRSSSLKLTELRSIMRAVFAGKDISKLKGDSLEFANALSVVIKKYSELGSAQRNIDNKSLKEQEKTLKRINEEQALAAKRVQAESRQKYVTDYTSRVLASRKSISTDVELSRAMVAAQRLASVFSSATGSTVDLAKAIRAGLRGEVVNLTGDMNRVYIAARNFYLQSQRLGSSFEQVRRGGALAGKSVADVISQLNAGVHPLEMMNKRTQELLISWQSFWRMIVARGITSAFYNIQREISEVIKTANELSIRISEIQTLSPKEQKFSDYLEIQKNMFEFSSRNNQNILDATRAFYETLSNQIGDSTSDIDGFMQSASDLSKITVSTIKESSDALASYLNAFGVSVSSSKQAVRDLFTLVDYGRIRLQDMENIGQLFASAGTLGVSPQEVMNSLAVVTRTGVKPALAMTLVRNSMEMLNKSTEEMRKQFDSWGVSSGRAAINTFGFLGVLEKLDKTARTQPEVLAKLAGTNRAYRGAILQLKDGYDNLNSSLRNFQDNAEKTDNALRVRLASPAEKLNKVLNEVKLHYMELVGSNIISFGRGVTDDTSQNIIKGLNFTTISAGAIAAHVAVKQLAGGVFILYDKLKTLKQMLTGVSTAIFAVKALSISYGLGAFAAVTTAAALYIATLKDTAQNIDSFVKKYRGKISELTQEELDTLNKVSMLKKEAVEKEDRAKNKEIADFRSSINKQSNLYETYIKDTLKLEEKASKARLQAGKENLKIANDYLDRLKDRNKELEKEIENIKKLQDARQTDLQSKQIERGARGLNLGQQANYYLGISSNYLALAKELSARSLISPNDSNLIDKASEAYKKAYEYADKYDQILWSISEAVSQEQGLNPLQIYQSNISQIENAINAIQSSYENTLVGMKKQEIFDTARELENTEAYIEKINSSIAYEETIIDNLKNIQAEIKSILEDELLTLDQKNSKLAEQYNILGTIDSSYAKISVAMQQQLQLALAKQEIEKSSISATENQETLDLAKQDYDKSKANVVVQLGEVREGINKFAAIYKEFIGRQIEQNYRYIDMKAPLPQGETPNLNADRELLDKLIEISTKQNLSIEEANNAFNIIKNISEGMREKMNLGLLDQNFKDMFTGSSLWESFTSQDENLASIQLSLNNALQKQNQVSAEVTSAEEMKKQAVAASTSTIEKWTNTLATSENVLQQLTNTSGPIYKADGGLVNFRPFGTDTIPAMLTPGEFVVNSKSAKAFLPELLKINAYSRGGIVSDYTPNSLHIEKLSSNNSSQVNHVVSNVTLQGSGYTNLDARLVSTHVSRHPYF